MFPTTCRPSRLSRGKGEVKTILLLLAVILALFLLTWFFRYAEEQGLVLPTPQPSPTTSAESSKE